MVLDMRPMLRGETKHIHIDYLLTPDLPDGAQFDGDAHVLGDVTDEAGYMHLILTVSVVYRTECARCLDPIRGDFAIQLERTVAAEGTLTEEQLEENVDEYAIIKDGKLDLGLFAHIYFIDWDHVRARPRQVNVTVFGTNDPLESRKYNNGEVVNTLRKFPEEEKAYMAQYDEWKLRYENGELVMRDIQFD
mgnify:CR=1 FL=1